MDHRRERLARARLYLVCDARPRAFLDAALGGGVDVVQLRDKGLDDRGLVAAARSFREACGDHEALFVLNDRPELVEACGADGVHVGQDDAPVRRARMAIGPERLVGRSTHSVAQVDAAREVDYIAVGPVHETPTKPGRPAIGLEPLRHAAAHARVPWFAIGGIDVTTIGPVLEAGARRVVVVRAIAEARDPDAAARALRQALDAVELREKAGVGST